MDKQSIYDRIGGQKSLSLAVDNFYVKVLADPLVNGFFKSIDMKKQAAQQKSFLTMALGGPDNYSGRDMREAHSKLKLTELHFTQIVLHFKDTLIELQVEQDIISEIVELMNSLKDEILNK